MNKKIFIAIIASLSMLMFSCNQTSKETKVVVEEAKTSAVKSNPAPLKCEHYSLKEGEVFYSGATSDMNNTGYFQVGFVLSADKKNVRCQRLNIICGV